jgi:hypothetical protein
MITSPLSLPYNNDNKGVLNAHDRVCVLAAEQELKEMKDDTNFMDLFKMNYKNVRGEIKYEGIQLDSTNLGPGSLLRNDDGYYLVSCNSTVEPKQLEFVTIKREFDGVQIKQVSHSGGYLYKIRDLRLEYWNFSGQRELTVSARNRYNCAGCCYMQEEYMKDSVLTSNKISSKSINEMVFICVMFYNPRITKLIIRPFVRNRDEVSGILKTVRLWDIQNNEQLVDEFGNNLKTIISGEKHSHN